MTGLPAARLSGTLPGRTPGETPGHPPVPGSSPSFARPGELRSLVRARKAVFVVEYELAPASFCAHANRAGFMAMRKRYALGAWRRPCRRRQ